MTKAKGPKFRVAFRRRREGITDYEKRLALIKSGKVRLVVRRTNQNVIVQFVEFHSTGDKVLFGFVSKKLQDLFNFPAKRNVWTAYLAGFYSGKEALKKGVKDFVLDNGRYTNNKGNLVFAVLKGVADAGIQTHLPEDKLPSEKLSAPPESIAKAFEDAKKKIAG